MTDMHRALDAAIKQNRTAKVTITLSRGGEALVNQDVMVEQTNHKVLFGANWGSSIGLVNGMLSGEAKALAEQQMEHFLALFNQVTMPFYWGRFEPEQGKPMTEAILNTARWFQQKGLLLKGHPLCWHTVCADWLLPFSNKQILKTQIGRIHREVADFAGVIDMWDVVNEAVIMPIFDKYDNAITRICKEMGRIELIRTMFDAARDTNPGAILLLNDFDVSPAYDILIEGCLAAGIQIDVIGIQTHMHQGYWGVEKTQRILERFERFNLPIHFTENTIVSGEIMPPDIVDLNDFQVKEWPSTPEGEARQKEEVMLHYKSLMAHPLIESITWWDFSDGAWLNAPAGLLRVDQSPKPAYEALMNLIKGEWWLSPTKLTTDANGQVNVSGFAGTYELTLGNQKIPFTIDKAGEASVALTV